MILNISSGFGRSQNSVRVSAHAKRIGRHSKQEILKSVTGERAHEKLLTAREDIEVSGVLKMAHITASPDFMMTAAESWNPHKAIWLCVSADPPVYSPDA